MKMAEEIDLYEDIFLPVDLCSKQHGEDENPSVASPAEVQQLRETSKQLSFQNNALKKNISCLFKTAQSELERKECMIERLMKRIKRLEWKLKNVQPEADQNSQPPPQTESTNSHPRKAVHSTNHQMASDDTRVEGSSKPRDKETSDHSDQTRRHREHLRRSSDRHGREEGSRRERLRSTDQSESKHLSSSLRRREDLRKHKMHNFSRSEHKRRSSISPAPSNGLRARHRDDYHHSQERRHHSHNKENRMEMLGRKRKHSHSPQPRDLREKLQPKTKRQRELSPRTSSSKIDTSSLSSSVDSCPLTPAWGELVEEDLLELEYEDSLFNAGSLDLSPPSTTCSGEVDENSQVEFESEQQQRHHSDDTDMATYHQKDETKDKTELLVTTCHQGTDCATKPSTESILEGGVTGQQTVEDSRGIDHLTIDLDVLVSEEIQTEHYIGTATELHTCMCIQEGTRDTLVCIETQNETEDTIADVEAENKTENIAVDIQIQNEHDDSTIGGEEELEDGEIGESDSETMDKQDSPCGGTNCRRSAIEVSREARARRERALKESQRHNTNTRPPHNEHKSHSHSHSRESSTHLSTRTSDRSSGRHRQERVR